MPTRQTKQAVSTHACSLMSRRLWRSSTPTAMLCFNPRLLVDEQATGNAESVTDSVTVSTHACSLMSRRPNFANTYVFGRGVSTHACSLMSRRQVSGGLREPLHSFNPRLLVDEQATWPPRSCRTGSGFNPRLLVDEQATSTRSCRSWQLACFNPRLLVDEQATWARSPRPRTGTVSTHACSLMSRRPRDLAFSARLLSVSTHACSLMSRRPC